MYTLYVRKYILGVAIAALKSTQISLRPPLRARKVGNQRMRRDLLILCSCFCHQIEEVWRHALSHKSQKRAQFVDEKIRNRGCACAPVDQFCMCSCCRSSKPPSTRTNDLIIRFLMNREEPGKGRRTLHIGSMYIEVTKKFARWPCQVEFVLTSTQVRR